MRKTLIYGKLKVKLPFINRIYGYQTKSGEWIFDYFKEILETDSSEYSLKDICLETLEDYTKLISYGVRFDVLRDNLFQFCIVFQIYSKEKEFLYNYYSYFDANGNLIDNFID